MSRFGTQVAQLCGLTAMEDANGKLWWWDGKGNPIVTDDDLNIGILDFLSEYEVPDDDRRTQRTDH